MNNIFAVCTLVSIEAKTSPKKDGFLKTCTKEFADGGGPKLFNEII